MDDVFIVRFGGMLHSKVLYQRCLGRFQVPPVLPRFLGTGHVRNRQNALMALLPSSMGRTRLYLAV